MSTVRPRRNGSISGTAGAVPSSAQSVPLVPKRPASASTLKPQGSVGGAGGVRPDGHAVSRTTPTTTPAGGCVTASVGTSSCCTSSNAVGGGGGSGSFFELLPKRRSTQPLKTYGVTARPATTSTTPIRSTAIETQYGELTVDHMCSAVVSMQTPTAASAPPLQPPVPPQPAASHTAPPVTPLPPLQVSDIVPTSTRQPPPPPSGWAHHFPSVGHYACHCGLPLFAATAKCRSLGGMPSFRRYFGPSLALSLSLSKTFDGAAQFIAACASCGADVGYAPLHRYALEAGDADDVHVLRVTMRTMQYRGARAPPEYTSLEVDVLSDDPSSDATTAERTRRMAGTMRRTSGGGVLRNLPAKSGPQGDASHQDDDTSDSDDADSDSGDGEDDALWLTMRSAVKRT